MLEFIRRYLVAFIRRRLEGRHPTSHSRYQLARSYYLLKLSLRQHLRDALLISMGVLSSGLGLRSFLLPNRFIDGGVTGISLLINAVGGGSLSVLIWVLNAPFVALAYRQISRTFALKSITAIAALSVLVAVFPYPVVTSDKLLIATFGGFFLGAGVGLSIRGGAVLDGTEVLAIFLSRKSSFSVSDIILLFNLVIFSVAAWMLGYETAMYATLTYLAAYKTVDFIIEGIDEYIGVTIVSSHHEAIRRFIVDKMSNGVTVYGGLRGHGKRGELAQTEIIFTVITRLEVARLQHEVEKIDPNAFLVMGSVRGIRGGILRKRKVGH